MPAMMSTRELLAAPFQNNVSGAFTSLQKAAADLMDGVSDLVIAYTGTSLMMGAYMGGATANLARPNAPNIRSGQLLAVKNPLFVPKTQSFMGGGNATLGNAFNIFDSRITSVSGWTQSAALGGLTAGGYPVRATAAATLSFSFTGAADTLVIYEGQQPSAGAYAANIDGSTVITASQATPTATAAINKRTISFAAVGSGAHTLNITWVSGTPIILGAEVHLSTTKGVRGINLGIGGSKASDWETTAPSYWGSLFTVTNAVAPHLVVHEIGGNDFLQGISLSTFSASNRAFISGVKADSSIIVMTPTPTANATLPLATQQLYVDTLIGDCVALGVPFIDEWRRKVSYEVQNAAGMMQDVTHPNSRGGWNNVHMMARAIEAALAA